MHNRYSGVLVFVIVHDNPQYGSELYSVTGYCQAILLLIVMVVNALALASSSVPARTPLLPGCL